MRNYWMIALLQAAGVHVCVRMHPNKQYDFDRGKRLGHLDHVVVREAPRRPKWMSEEEYKQLPLESTSREIGGIDLPQRGAQAVA